jgi:hypothetical protein
MYQLSQNPHGWDQGVIIYKNLLSREQDSTGALFVGVGTSEEGGCGERVWEGEYGANTVYTYT